MGCVRKILSPGEEILLEVRKRWPSWRVCNGILPLQLRAQSWR